MVFVEKSKYKNYYGIYCIFNVLTGDAYVGQTKQKFEKRFWHHQWKLKDNSHDNQHLQRAWNLYGEEFFNFYVLKVVDNPDVLDELEIKYIDIYKQMGNSYNILEGGNVSRRGIHLSEEHKRKIGEANKKNGLGRKASDETKKKMSKARKGKSNITKNTKLTKELAYEIKIMLVHGDKASDIAKKLDIEYRHINNIISNNSWESVYVEGWNEFRDNRKTYKRLTQKDHEEIYKLYLTKEYSIKELSEKYCRTEDMIKIIIKKYSV